jgi:hypothetical protein
MSRAGLAAFVILMSGATIATLAFKEAAVLSAAIGAISALAVAAAVAHNRRGRHGAYAGAIGAIALLTVAAVLFGWGHRPLVIFAVCFFLMLPLLVGLNGWAALALMRSLLAGATRGDRRWWPVLLAMTACWLIGALFVATLAFLLGYVAEGYNQVTLTRSDLLAFDIEPMIAHAVAAPFDEGLWLTLMLLTPMIAPALLTASFVTDGLLRLQPYDYLFRRLVFRALGIALASAALVGALALIDASEHLEPAGLLGSLAMAGLDAAHDNFGTPSIR